MFKWTDHISRRLNIWIRDCGQRGGSSLSNNMTNRNSTKDNRMVMHNILQRQLEGSGHRDTNRKIAEGRNKPNEMSLHTVRKHTTKSETIRSPP